MQNKNRFTRRTFLKYTGMAGALRRWPRAPHPRPHHQRRKLRPLPRRRNSRLRLPPRP